MKVVEAGSRSRDRGILLHLAEQDGEGCVTQCGRKLAYGYDQSRHRLAVQEAGPGDNFVMVRVCERCGSLDDYEAIWQAYADEEAYFEECKRLAREMAQELRLEKEALLEEELVKLATAIRPLGWRVVGRERTTVKFQLRKGGYTYRMEMKLPRCEFGMSMSDLTVTEMQPWETSL